MKRMNIVGTYVTLAAAAAYVSHRLWQCYAAPAAARPVRQHVMSMLFGGRFGMAVFYFQNNPEVARDVRLFLPSEYLTPSPPAGRRCCSSRPFLGGSCAARGR
jgi:hypothetical protein